VCVLQRVDQVKRSRSASEGGASCSRVGSAQAAVSDSAEPPPVLFLVRVVGDQFSFYSTRMSAAFAEGIADYDKIVPQQVTSVYRLQAATQVMQAHSSAAASAAVHAAPALASMDRWQFKVPAERQVIIEALDRFRQAMLA
jgi:hypothetical protein